MSATEARRNPATCAPDLSTDHGLEHAAIKVLRAGFYATADAPRREKHDETLRVAYARAHDAIAAHLFVWHGYGTAITGALLLVGLDDLHEGAHRRTYPTADAEAEARGRHEIEMKGDAA